jgi:hypothetical protein
LALTGSLTEADFKKWFEDNQTALKASLAGCSGFSATLKIKVNAQGNVTSVVFSRMGKNCVKGAKRLVKAILATSFPALSGGQGCKIEFTLIL